MFQFIIKNLEHISKESETNMYQLKVEKKNILKTYVVGTH